MPGSSPAWDGGPVGHLEPVPDKGRQPVEVTILGTGAEHQDPASSSGHMGSGYAKRGPQPDWLGPRFEWLSGGVLLSHPVAGAVPSALRGLASGFGM